jgi:hypothetical protein
MGWVCARSNLDRGDEAFGAAPASCGTVPAIRHHFARSGDVRDSRGVRRQPTEGRAVTHS